MAAAGDGNLDGVIGMQRILPVIFIGVALVGPAAAQGPNVQQLLQGLTTGNQGQDQALRDAFERGYQHGRQDEARQQRSDRNASERFSRQGPDDRDRRDYQDRRDVNPPYGQQGGSSNR